MADHPQLTTDAGVRQATGNSTGARHFDAPGDPDEAAAQLDLLRAILLEQSRERMILLQDEVEQLQALIRVLEEKINDEDALVATITPILADAVSTSIRDSRDEMIEALYPITGRLVTKSVTEAMRDLMRNIDNQMRNTFSFDTLRRTVQARASGLSDAEMAMRAALPFAVEEIFVIHRDSGLLLHHETRDPESMSDSDLISGMLTAIRDFAQDAFGQGEEGQLDEIQYGERSILIEVGKYAYMAVVVEGFEPMGYRTRIRERLYNIEHTFYRQLREYDGDASTLVGIEGEVAPLLLSDAQAVPTQDSTSLLEAASVSAGSTVSTDSVKVVETWTPNSRLFLSLCCVVLLLFGWRLLGIL